MATILLLALPYTTENLTRTRVSMLNPRQCGDNQNVIALHHSPATPQGGGGGGTLIFYVYICLADFFGVKILKFSIFFFLGGGVSEKSLFWGVVSF